MDSVYQADSDLEVVVLHHLPQAVVHGFNHFTTSVPEGDTTTLKILFKMI